MNFNQVEELPDFQPEFSYINTTIVDGHFSIEKKIIDSLVTERVLVYDKVSGQTHFLIPFDFESETSTEYIFEFIPETSYIIPDWTGKLLKRFHWTWYDRMKEFLNSKKFQEMNLKLNNNVRSKIQLFPSKEDVYNAFSTNFYDIKVVIIGQSPYHSGNHANGWAFASKQQAKPVSLQMIEGAVGSRLPNDLSNWIQQGVLLLNSSLTVGQNPKIEYREEWRPLLVEALTKLQESNLDNYLVFLLMGNHAQEFESLIEKNHYGCIKVEHPAAASYNKRLWEHQDCFNRVNELLVQHQKLPIQWEL